MADRYCRNCGHELAETDRFCPNCGTPVHEAAHVPTPEADVDVPSPPQQAGVTTPPPEEVRREDFPVVFFTIVAAVGGSIAATLVDVAGWGVGYGVGTPLAYRLLALFLGVLLPVVVDLAFGYSARCLRLLPTHLVLLTIGIFGLGAIGIVIVMDLLRGMSVTFIMKQEWPLAQIVLIPASVSLTTTMFYASSAFIGHARRRQKAGEPSPTATSVREASDQPQTPRQQAMGRLSGENWTPRQQAMIGLIGTITAALIGLFGVLIQVFSS
jgi:hypothetical protein